LCELGELVEACVGDVYDADIRQAYDSGFEHGWERLEDFDRIYRINRMGIMECMEKCKTWEFPKISMSSMLSMVL
jgi:hypothetical protein